MGKRRFVVLDRDGTIIFERNYLSDPAQVELIPGAAEALAELRKLGLGLIVVTNQSAIGRGIIDEERLSEIHDRFLDLLRAEGIEIDGIYHCPHLPEDGCNCRKPATGLLERAAGELDFLPSDCFVIGDKPCDIELGRNAGAATFLVRTGYGISTSTESDSEADYVVDGLVEAAYIIARIADKSDDT
ncbi:MAG: D-glycero-alpha-D-manno-heptose-1,7-bisphosphate 7-phosphatase [Planctomycetota bacterium]|jgi:D-glycero-D-manno-heptose 1,7-bisphosphate phosphatase